MWLEAVGDAVAEGGPRVITLADISAILAERGASLSAPKHVTASKVASMLLAEGYIKELVLKSRGSAGGGPKKVLAYGDLSTYGLAASIRKDSYLSHLTALFLHGLLGEEPRIIYTNKEQSLKARSGRIVSQEAIDRAFKGRARESNRVFEWGDQRIVFLSGKNTGRLGVRQVKYGAREVLDTTSIERTLVDIAVRPSYSGGASGVLEAYRAARGTVDVGQMAEILMSLGYTYPYHQSIGYLLEKAGYRKGDLSVLREIPIEWNFYLEYGGGDLTLDEKWRVYHPRSI